MVDMKPYIKRRKINEKINEAKPTSWVTEGLSFRDIDMAVISAILTELKLARVSDTHIKAAINIAENTLEAYNNKEEK